MKISVIGLGLSYKDLTAAHLSLIGGADVLVGGERHLAFFPDFSGEKIEIKKNVSLLPDMLLKRQKEEKQIVVLASGDPLFYGIGSYLAKKIGKDKVEIYSNISSVAAAFSRIGEPWQDAKVVSFHGRPITEDQIRLFQQHDKVAVLTDHEHTPERISKMLYQHLIEGYVVYVFEHLGEPDETITRFDSVEKVSGPFSEPNLMVVLKNGQAEKPAAPVFLGMPDTMFSHERGLITKPDIRVLTLSKLMLSPDSVLWDLGAGSGSVSIEASFFITWGKIFAVEKNENRVADIQKNKKTFGVHHLSVIHGTLPEALETLPDPDRVFIGGGGKYLPEIIERSVERLPQNGVIVVNTVLLGSMSKSLSVMETLGLGTEIIQVQVNTGHDMPYGEMLKAQNPVFIIKGTKV